VSQRQVLVTALALLQDNGVGLKAKTDALAGQSTATIRSDFNFTKWTLRGPLNPAAAPNVMLRPRSWNPDQKLAVKPDRTSWSEIEIGYEYFGTDPDEIQENITIVATAVAQVLDGLRDYSDAHAGTIADVRDPLQFLFGEFAGPSSAGFIARATILERSSQ
jgi:hypothetical protein